MPHFHQIGEVPRRGHMQFRQSDGSLYYEELTGQDGFYGDSTLMYHAHSPSAVTGVEPLDWKQPMLVPNYPMLPRHFKPGRLAPGSDPVSGRVAMMGNDDLTVSYCSAAGASPLYRNTVGDELIFVHAGSADLETTYGRLSVSRGDYVVIPTSTTHRWIPLGESSLDLLIIESSGHITPPQHYLSERGQYLTTAPYCELDIRGPAELLRDESRGVDVIYRQRSGLTTYTMSHHTFDVVGWFGCMYPYAFNIWDFSPITGSFHRPPPAHATFNGPKFVVCSFVPRKIDYHAEALPVPPFHANVDCDEILFYAEGSFLSRQGSGIERGSISLHPAGFIHGPHPGSAERAIGMESTEETAVMIDTFSPLQLSNDAFDIEDRSYVNTWVEA